MEQSAPLPNFVEDRRIPTKPIHLARFSRDGKLLAIIHTDLSLSIWDSEDILVNTFEFSFFESRSKNRDWSATNKYLYLIVDRIGFQIDVYTKPKEPHSFTFDQPLNSFSAHPTVDHLCIATCMDELIELYITEKEQSMRFKYRSDIKTETNRKSTILSYAEYTNIDGTILFWVQSFLYLLKPKQPIDHEQPAILISSIQIKSSQPLQQRIRIDANKQRCIIACRNEITMYSLPSFDVEWSYRDTVNDSPWKAIDYFSEDNMVLALPEVYVSEGPVFYLLPTEGKTDSQIYRNPQEKLCWALIHPRGKTLFFCDDDGGIVLFKREKEEFTWSGPMYPYHFTYLKKNKQGDEEISKDFELTYFPPNDRGIDLSQCSGAHPINICNNPPTPPSLLPIDLQLVKEEYDVMEKVNQLPLAIEDIYPQLSFVCFIKGHNDNDILSVVYRKLKNPLNKHA